MHVCGATTMLRRAVNSNGYTWREKPTRSAPKTDTWTKSDQQVECRLPSVGVRLHQQQQQQSLFAMIKIYMYI